MSFQTDLLTQIGPDRVRSGGELLIVTPVHNERDLVASFLAHYRGFGDVHFAVVDDRSTDGTREAFAREPDVTLFAPRPESRYDRDKGAWRGQILDRMAAGRWVAVPDIDEHLVWRGQGRRGLGDVIAGFEREAAEAAFCVMIDMYRDAPIADHVYAGGPLARAFPFFDDPARDPLNTRMELAPRGFRRDWPTPAMHVIGGMRQRLFGRRQVACGDWRDRLVASFPSIRDPSPRGAQLLLEQALRRLTNQPRAEKPLNLTKIALLKWKPGSRFFGGPHAIRPAYRLGRERLALLHYPITRGFDGIAYLVGRGQHARGAVHYREIAESAYARQSPVYPGTSRYNGPDSLSAFLGATNGVES